MKDRCYRRDYVRRHRASLSRVLVVGWDGGTWTVADPLLASGRLPALASIRAAGAHGVLQSVPNMNSAPAWSTVATGLSPGRHGIFYFDEPVPGTYDRRIINAARRSGRTIWNLASRAGKKMVVVNVPISYPAEPVNGVLVAGLDTPSKALPGFTYPPHLARKYAGVFDGYSIEPGAKALMRAGRVPEAADLLMRAIEGWAAVTERLLSDEDWDLAFVVFTSSDTAQHFFWTDEQRRIVDRVYELQDQATDRLLRLARERDPDVNVLVIADHGGTANTRGPEFMSAWLEDFGYQLPTRGSTGHRVRVSAFRLLDRTLRREQKLALANRFPRLRQRAQSEARLAGIDWSGTAAYSDGIRDEVMLNVAGREPLGTLAPREEEAIIAELKERIGSIREVGTGRPVVASVLHRSESYAGPFVPLAPDLTVRWVTEGPIKGFEARTEWGRRRMREIAARPPFQPGGHHPEGILAACGPNVTPGPTDGELADVAPTVLALLGVPVPDGLDGRPLSFLSKVDVRTSESPAADSPRASQAQGYTPEEEVEVRRRLEDLGYI